MALELNFWEADGPRGEAVHHAYRLVRIADADKKLREFLACMSQGSIVRVTLDRSDHQSPVSRELWIKPGYVDPFAEVTK